MRIIHISQRECYLLIVQLADTKKGTIDELMSISASEDQYDYVDEIYSRLSRADELRETALRKRAEQL